MSTNIVIKNKKASFEYELIEKFIAGIQLYGTEIKSIRLGKASLVDSYCQFYKNELYVKMNITEYDHGSYYNHDPRRERKLLLKRNELKRLEKKVTATGLTIIPTKLFVNDKGLAKIEIALARGKKMHDKREDIKQKDSQREIDRHWKK
jgi:SsrA-binding protein